MKYEVRSSPICGTGLYATQVIDDKEKIIEYFGKKVSKEESTERCWSQLEKSAKSGEGGVYIFTLDEECLMWDVSLG